jgi:chromosome segregation ATPase
MSSIRLYLLQISPITWFNRLSLRYKRYKSLTRALQEEIVYKKLERQKLHSQLHTFNKQWKELNQEIQIHADKVKNISVFDKTSGQYHAEFLDNVKAINQIGNPGEKIRGLEELVGRLIQHEEDRQNQSVVASSQTSRTYRDFLDLLLHMTTVELNYWKAEQSIEDLNQDIEKVQDKLEYYSQKFGFLFR